MTRLPPPLVVCPLVALLGCASAPPPVPEPGSEPSAMVAPAEEGAAAGGPLEPCRLAVEGDSPVDEACRRGGVAEAKAVMKALVRDARGQGVQYQCDDCHINSDDFTQLGQTTDAKFARLLSAARRAAPAP